MITKRNDTQPKYGGGDVARRLLDDELNKEKMVPKPGESKYIEQVLYKAYLELCIKLNDYPK